MSNRQKIRTERAVGTGLEKWLDHVAAEVTMFESGGHEEKAREVLEAAPMPGRRVLRANDNRVASVEMLPAAVFADWTGKSAARKARRLADRTAAGRFA